MEKKIIFKTEYEKNEIIRNNKDLYVIKTAYHIDENYLILSDILDLQIHEDKDRIIQELENKIDGQDAKLLDAEFKLALIDMNNTN